MKIAPENRNKAFALIGVSVVALAVGGYLLFSGTRDPSAHPDEETRAAMERSDKIRANMTAAPAAPDLPVESRAGRGAIKPK